MNSTNLKPGIQKHPAAFLCPLLTYKLVCCIFAAEIIQFFFRRAQSTQCRADVLFQLLLFTHESYPVWAHSITGLDWAAPLRQVCNKIVISDTETLTQLHSCLSMEFLGQSKAGFMPLYCGKCCIHSFTILLKHTTCVNKKTATGLACCNNLPVHTSGCKTWIFALSKGPRNVSLSCWEKYCIKGCFFCF